jgi:hypothetical protein
MSYYLEYEGAVPDEFVVNQQEDILPENDFPEVAWDSPEPSDVNVVQKCVDGLLFVVICFWIKCSFL